MKIGAAFPSNYLKAADLPNGSPVMVAMSEVRIEDVAGSGNQEDQKPVLHFLGKDKGLVLNKTNANMIAHHYGDETDGWTGKEILLYVDQTSFQGRIVDCIRVKVRPQEQPTPQPVAAAVSEPTATDDIPF